MNTNRLLERRLTLYRRAGIAERTLLLFAVILAACSLAYSSPRAGAVRLAVVNGDTIDSEDMDRLLVTSHRAMSVQKKESFQYRKLLEKLVNDRLIMQEAKAMGMDAEEDFVERLRDEQRKKARRLFVRETFRPALELSEDDITKQFERFYWKMQVRTIGVTTATEAERLLAQVKAGASMDSIAREVSLDSRRFLGGLHNLKHWKDVVMEVREAALDLAAGEFSEVFRFRDAFMFLRVEQRSEADPAERAYFEKEIKTVLTNARKASAWNQFLDSLAGHYPQVVDTGALARIQADSSKVFLGDFLRGSERSVVRVALNEVISEQALRREISHAAMNSGDQTFSEILATALEASIHQSRLMAAAVERGFPDRPSILQHIATLRDSLLVQIYLNENIVEQMVFNREEFKDYYDQHLEEFREPGEVRLAVLQLKDRADAEKGAGFLSDGADFDYVASRLGRKDGDDHDENQWLSLKTFPRPVSEALELLSLGQTSEPFALAEGWVIFKLIGRRDGEVKSMDDVDGQIREVMFQRKFNELLDNLLASLKDASEIVYDEAAIAAYFGEDN
ncbi:MAG: peptidyl-prolyl cis-trans isomerase [candidate division Zixibacteria bacterium]|nr:peptidyl-prolyl cis-trans isomerase [candidate division Zixibacteria bacterium]MDH3937550.1 peptidyl-prolyl cis-trans isomerase [candidate division Zixibacteria bacterium]MDH4034666.1 peptidyl-prolyl cis-trans isomerase [candidate division Zixibacteria bacterium]